MFEKRDLSELLNRRISKRKDIKGAQPNVLFVHKYIATKFGIVPALIMADLAYWLIMRSESSLWRQYKSWAKMFGCSEKTIARSVDLLRREKIIVTQRTIYNNGSRRGTLIFYLERFSQVVDILISDYKLISNLFDTDGGIEECEQQNNEFVIQIVPVNLIAKYGVKGALFLSRVMGPIASIWGRKAATFLNRNAMAEFCWMTRSTSVNVMDRLATQGVIRVVELEGFAFAIVAGEQGEEVVRWFVARQEEMDNRRAKAY